MLERVHQAPLKALIQPSCLARLLTFVLAIFMAHENDDNKGHQETTRARHDG